MGVQLRLAVAPNQSPLCEYDDRSGVTDSRRQDGGRHQFRDVAHYPRVLGLAVTPTSFEVRSQRDDGDACIEETREF